MHLCIFTLTSSSTRPTPSELHGFLATEHSLHHQYSFDRIIYRYPLVQYKIIDGAPIDDGARSSTQIYDIYYEIKYGGA